MTSDLFMLVVQSNVDRIVRQQSHAVQCIQSMHGRQRLVRFSDQIKKRSTGRLVLPLKEQSRCRFAMPCIGMGKERNELSCAGELQIRCRLTLKSHGNDAIDSTSVATGG